ncbi:hypothetical protein LptCag_1065 [Leptospirillum ferriphilum]|uniref:Uncharacterized protein n=1 Tax=Leptospirillum ferriphilum TaxID=178606 RepID=A0A094WF81_9BACT|nr:hypothetical protein LptCag_1065 [Leptospirillum ferriphilum]
MPSGDACITIELNLDMANIGLGFRKEHVSAGLRSDLSGPHPVFFRT